MEVRPVPPPFLSTWVYSGGAKGGGGGGGGGDALEISMEFFLAKEYSLIGPKGVDARSCK